MDKFKPYGPSVALFFWMLGDLFIIDDIVATQVLFLVALLAVTAFCISELAHRYGQMNR